MKRSSSILEQNAPELDRTSRDLARSFGRAGTEKLAWKKDRELIAMTIQLLQRGPEQRSWRKKKNHPKNERALGK